MSAKTKNLSKSGETKRDFLQLTAAAFSAVGVGCVAWPFVHSLNPAQDTLALASIEVDLSPISEGQAITVMWRGKPVFIRHRTQEEIASAQEVELDGLIDREADDERTQKSQWLVILGICTHLGCVPTGQKSGHIKGDYDGWFCPCHGSHYDTSGRIRKGPAPKNLPVPPYEFVSDTRIKVG